MPDASPHRRPNILFILIDDMGYADLGCYGSSFYETPNLDRLAAEGLRFTDGYAACPVCSPTRASLMTGKYPATVGITNFIPGNAWGKLMGVPYFYELPKGETTVASALRDAGYATAHVGKWHLGGPDRYPHHCGFDTNIAGQDWGAPKHGYFSPYGLDTMSDGPGGEYLTDRLTDETIALVDRYAESPEKPWFVNLCHYAVHTPIQAPADLVAKYEKKAADLGIDPDGDLVEGDHFTCLHKADQRIVRRTRQSHPTYAAMVENLDTNLGRLFDALKRNGQWDNTLILFTSDNGGLSTAEGSPTCNAPLCEGKGWMYDGGVREPWLAHWPERIQPGETTDAVITSPDLFPTLLEVAEADPLPDQHVDGKSFAPALLGEAFDRGPIFWHYPHYSNQGDTPACSVRDGRYKLIEWFEDGRIELYDLVADIGEAHNLADTMPDVRDRLHGQLKAWRDEVGAKIPDVNPDYDAMLAGSMPSPNGHGVLPPIPGGDH
ncbi:MAG: sulfatase [Planctomycetota bacterium]